MLLSDFKALQTATEVTKSMDFHIVIRQRVLHCQDEVFECLMSGMTKPELLEQKDVLTLRFLPFEKHLLEQVIASSPLSQIPEVVRNSERITRLARVIFFRWSWAFDVLRQLLTDLHPDNVAEPHVQTVEKAVQDALSFLRAKKIDSRRNLRAKRTKLLLQDNPQLTGAPTPSITYESLNIKPHADDLHIWKLLAVAYEINLYGSKLWIGFRAIMDDLTACAAWTDAGDTSDEAMQEQAYHLAAGHDRSEGNDDSHSGLGQPGASQLKDDSDEMVTNHVDKLIDSEDTLDVWRLYRTFRLAQSRPQNGEALQILTGSKEFSSNWESSTNTELNGFFSRRPFHETAPVCQAFAPLCSKTNTPVLAL